MTVPGLTMSNADRQSFHNCESQTQTVSPTEAPSVATAGTLQDQELMAEGENLGLQNEAR